MRVKDLLSSGIGRRRTVPDEEETKAVVGCTPSYPYPWVVT